MKQKRIYIDTSVIGGCFDEEFSKYSNLLFSYFKKSIYIPIISEIVTAELENAPDYVRNKILEITNIETVVMNNKIQALSKKYLKAKILTEKFANDSLHIAIATIINADVLVSWNFKHIVNFNKIHKFNSVNRKQGYNILEIRTPREVVENE